MSAAPSTLEMPFTSVSERQDLPEAPVAQTGRATRRPTATLRRGIQALVRSLRFCLIRNLTGEYRFIDVNVVDETLPREQVEFLLFLTEGRTCAEILRALPNATKACHFDDRFGREFGEYFERLGQMLKYNSESYMLNEPIAQPAAHYLNPFSHVEVA